MRGLTLRVVLVLLLGLSFVENASCLLGRRSKFLGLSMPSSRNRHAEKSYGQTLEEQTQVLERQLRAAREESAQLRKLLKLNSSSRRKATAKGTRASKTIEESLRVKLTSLQSQISKLHELLQRAESLMEEEGKKTKQLEQLLNDERNLSVERQSQYKRDLAQLQQSLAQQSEAQLKELQLLMEQRVKEAAEKARDEAMKEIDQKVKEAKDRVLTRADKNLAAERKKAQQGIERERAKMRKLVKALAEREKKLLQQTSSANVDVATSTTVPRSSAVSSTQTVQHPPTKVATPYLP